MAEHESKLCKFVLDNDVKEFARTISGDMSKKLSTKIMCKEIRYELNASGPKEDCVYLSLLNADTLQQIFFYGLSPLHLRRLHSPPHLNEVS